MKISKYGDIGNNEVLKHKSLKITIVDGQPRARVKNVSPIDTMYNRGQLNIAQYSAGTTLYASYVKGWGNNNSYEIRERVDSGSRVPEMTTSQIYAMNQYATGIKAAGIEVKLVNSVVIQEIPLTKRGMSGHAIKQLKKRFSNTLNDIAKAYGYI